MEIRGRPEKPQISPPCARPREHDRPDIEDLARTAIGSKKAFKKEKTTQRAQVSIAHGNLGYARNPIMVGHYKGDTILLARKYLSLLICYC